MTSDPCSDPIHSLRHLVACTLVVLAGCIAPDGDDGAPPCSGGKCDGAVDQSCSDPRYGDGTCQTELSCAVPDIDCFVTFQTDEQAATWFSEFEAGLAGEEGRAPRAILPATDPRFVKMRAFLDRGWEAFRVHRPVGELASVRPALVMLEDATANAYVAPDWKSGKSALAVIALTGLGMQDATDDAVLGVMMHELQHGIGLHLINNGEAKARMRRFYVAPDGSEPIGKLVPEHARARDAGVPWRALSEHVGIFANAELGGLPIAGELNQVFNVVLARGLQTNPSGCARSQQLVSGVFGGLGFDALGGALTSDLSTLRPRVDAALAAMRDECLPDVTATFAQVVAAIRGVTPEVIEMQMSAEDKALIANKHIVDAIAALTIAYRARMRSIEAKFEQDVGRPWSALRFFSFEEDADDVSVPVLRAAGFDPTGNGEFLQLLLPGDARTRCAQMLADGEVPPYGIDILDEHHATCWRAYHIRALAEHTAKARPREVAPATTPVDVPRRLLPPRFSEMLVH